MLIKMWLRMKKWYVGDKRMVPTGKDVYDPRDSESALAHDRNIKSSLSGEGKAAGAQLIYTRMPETKILTYWARHPHYRCCFCD